MIGALLGDIIGSVYEFNPTKTKDFPIIESSCRFTDDSVMTVAVAKGALEAIKSFYAYEANNHLLTSDDKENVFKSHIINYMKAYGRVYDFVGYGGYFTRWIHSDSVMPYNSYGNGSAMRVSSIGWMFKDLEETPQYAKWSAEVTHNHPEGIKGAQATAMCIWLARNGVAKETIKSMVSSRFGYDLNRTVDSIRENYEFEVSCQKSVPEAIICFLESTDIEDAIRNAVSLGGDADTQACIAGSIAEAFYYPDGSLFKNVPNFQLTKYLIPHIDVSMLCVEDRIYYNTYVKE